jgi:hypothetical protein
MNVKEMILGLNREYCEKLNMELVDDIDELLLTVLTKYQLFEPCRYLSEDDEWLNVVMLSFDGTDMSQAMTLKKSEITALGIFNQEEIEIDFEPQKGSEDLYQ